MGRYSPENFSGLFGGSLKLFHIMSFVSGLLDLSWVRGKSPFQEKGRFADGEASPPLARPSPRSHAERGQQPGR